MAKKPAEKPLDAVAMLESLDKAQLDERIAALTKERDALKTLRKAVAARDGEEPSRKPRKPRAAPGGGKTIRQRVIEYLKYNGPTSLGSLAKGVGLENQQVCSSLQTPEFERTADRKWRLATDD